MTCSLCVFGWFFSPPHKYEKRRKGKEKKDRMKREVHFPSEFSDSDSLSLIKRYGSLPWNSVQVGSVHLCSYRQTAVTKTFTSVWKDKGGKRKNRGRF